MTKLTSSTAGIVAAHTLALAVLASPPALANQQQQDLSALIASSAARPPAGSANTTSVHKSQTNPSLAASQIFLIRSTLSALNDANQTGNYTVLRDTAAPTFSQKYTAADLALAFTNLRNNPRFSEACAGTPSLIEPSRSTPDGTIQFRGQMGPREAQLQFNIQYQRIANRYRLSALAVTLPDATAAQHVPRSAQQSAPR